ncbi:MAG: filamentous hemagglutinin N-terminal domain-containing protein, partial [Leptolyngbya sp. SIO3F4]|nr:filamentous hemagglutinin N-terminal domain-containing protein [Leptolyngbya sp. SIO3F4]
MNKQLFNRCTYLIFILAPLIVVSPAESQILPDTTLGNESSIVVPDVKINSIPSNRIEGGASRGSNLFHSFTDFNVLPSQSIYFANPVGIDSILSRVTGSNPSNILGILGVDGSADLFLINPHGLLFGTDAQLDIKGSFYGTTATAVELGENGTFSATDPAQSQLLTVSPSISFWNYLGETSGTIVNRGQLAIGGDLILAGNSLNLEGQVAAIGDVALLATDTVKVRDTATVPFVGAAGGELTIQGNQGIDIVALRHPNSQLFSGGEMTLRSDGSIGGDAHYLSGGNFRVETLDSRAGKLYSPIDPIVRSFGDVVIGEYVGTSLHILSGGSVTLGSTTISAPDAGIANIDFLQETITLSDGTLVDINGGDQATLDVRAGVSPESIGTPPLQILTGFDAVDDEFTDAFATATPTSADITIGDVIIEVPNGLILLTNQYQPNNGLTDGDILIDSQLTATENIGGIAAADFEGGSIFLDSRNNITVLDSIITVPPSETMTNSIVLLANETIQFDSPEGFPTGIFSLALPVTNNTTNSASSVRVQANNIELLNGSQINTSTLTAGSGGNVRVEARETLSLDGSNSSLDFLSSIGSAVLGTGDGGNVVIIANDLVVTNGAGINTSTAGDGNAGNLTLDINETTLLEGGVFLDDSILSGIISSFRVSGIASETFDSGQGGEIVFNTGNLIIKDGAAISAASLGSGNAGDITLNVRDTALLEGGTLLESDTLVSSLDDVFENIYSPSGISSDAISEGAAGIISLNAGNLVISEGATITASTFIGTGNAGSIILNIRDDLRIEGGVIIEDAFLIDDEVFDIYAQSSIASDTLFASGQDGRIDINATNLTVTGGAEISAETIGTGDAGNIVLNIRETARFDGLVAIEGLPKDARPSIAASGISTETNSLGTNQGGEGGDIELNATDLVLTNGATLSASTSSSGRAGDIVLNITDTAKFDGAGVVEGTFSMGNGILQVTNPG